MEWNTTVMRIQLICVDCVGKSSLVPLTEDYSSVYSVLNCIENMF